MFTVLLADDELMSLYAIKSSFDWDTYEFSKIYETTNSREALEILLNHRIDMAFLDIRMPELSGLDIIEKCVSEGVESYFVIITGYSEFDYAQTALRLRAIDYCLKPVDKDEAYLLIKKLHHIVLENRIKTDQKILQRILNSKDSEVQQLLTYYNLDCQMPYFRVICWKGDYLTGYSKIKTSDNSIVSFILDNERCIFIEAHNQVKSFPIQELHKEYVVISNDVLQTDQLPSLIQHAQSVWLNCDEGITSFNHTNSVSDSLQPMLMYLNQNLSQDINLAQLAQLFSFNYTYCSELFKKVTGTNFTNYVTKMRIDAACELLKNTDQSIECISMQVGFVNYHYFANVFRRYTGMTSSQYRQAYKS